MNPLQKLHQALTARNIAVSSAGSAGVFRFPCPHHNGKRESVVCSLGDGGRLLLHCHSAGCSAEQIAAAVGLTMADLHPAPPRTSTKNERRKVDVDGRSLTLHQDKQAAIRAAAFSVWKALEKSGVTFDPNTPPAFTFDYTTATGEPSFSVCRWHVTTAAGRQKELRQIRCVQGGWVVAGPSPADRRPLYRLQQLLTADPSELVYVVEGERACDALRAKGFVVVTSSGGSSKPQSTDWAPLAGRGAVILPDADEPGEKFAAAVAKILGKLDPPCGASIGRLRDDCPELPVKGDSVEWLALRAGESLERLQARLAVLPDRTAEILAASGAAGGAGAAGGSPDDAADELPKISLGYDESAAADEAITHLAKVADLFCTDSGLVRLLATDEASLCVHVLGEPGLRDILSKVVELEDEKGKQCRPPKWLLESIRARPDWPGVRKLRGIRNSPALRPDGSLIREPGWDQASGLFCEFSAQDWPEIPQNPSRADAVAALEQLADIVCDFPFASPADRSGWLAALLTVVGRQLIAGPCPGILFDASIRGAGKSMLCDLAGIIAAGGAPPRSSWSVGDESEARKRLSSILFAPQPPALCLFDNIGGKLRSDALEAVLTAEHWEDRVLGASVVKRVPIRTLFLFSANNAQLSSDLSRRLLRVRLEPTDETPEERAGFRYPDLKGHVQANRPELLSCALIALSAYVREGCPGSSELVPWGSFEHWSTIVRGCLVWAGQSDPATTRRALREESDSDSEALAVFVGMLREVDPWGHGLSTDQMIGFASGQGDPGESDLVRVALETIAGKPLSQLSSRTIGNALAKFRGRPMAGFRLERKKSNGRAIWNLRPVSASFAENSDSVTQVTLSPATHGNENSEFTFT